MLTPNQKGKITHETDAEVSLDAKHIIVLGHCLTFDEAKGMANDILGKIEYTLIWGNRNSRSNNNE